MNKALRFILIFAGGSAVTMLLVALFVVFQSVNTLNRYFAGMDSYTCGQFTYDMTHEDTDKMFPMAVATIAYGKGVKDAQGNTDGATLESTLASGGIEPAVKKVLNACQQRKPNTKLLDMFATEVVKQAGVSPTTQVAASISPTQPKTQKGAE